MHAIPLQVDCIALHMSAAKKIFTRRLPIHRRHMSHMPLLRSSLMMRESLPLLRDDFI